LVRLLKLINLNNLNTIWFAYTGNIYNIASLSR
jgi:hypothetical protein